ncbi:MAG: glycosyltransferase family 4 protein [Thermoleophilaceae bacterium]
MKIAVVEHAAIGGLLHYAFQLADGLAGRGHDVHLLAPRGHELEGVPTQAKLRPVLVPPTTSTSPPSNRLLYEGRRALIASRLVRGWSRVLWEVRAHGYDVVILNCDITFAPITQFATALTVGPGPVICDVCHNVRPFAVRSREDIFDTSDGAHGWLRRLYPRFDLVFVHGEGNRELFEEVWGGRHVAAIPHGDESVFTSEPPPPSNEERILFFGDFRKNKGLPVLMEAFDRLSERRPDVKLTIAGTPAPAELDPATITDWAATQNHGRVTVVDQYVPLEKVPELFGSSRVVVTPYTAGFQSGVVHLAMTMARAVVTSDVGELGKTVRDGETGLVVPPGDPARLAEALERLISDPETARRYGEAGREHVLSSSGWETVAEKVEAALLELPALRGAQSPHQR